MGAGALGKGLCNTFFIHDPSIFGSSLTLRAVPMMYLALWMVTPIRLALTIVAATGALETPVMQWMYALSPCLSEFITYGISVRRSSLLALGLDISHLKMRAPGIVTPYMESISQVSSGQLLKQNIWMLNLVSLMTGILLVVGSGPSHSSPLPHSSQIFATSLGGSGLGRLPCLCHLSE